MKFKENITTHVENAMIQLDSIVVALNHQSISAVDIVNKIAAIKDQLQKSMNYLDSESGNFYE